MELMSKEFWFTELEKGDFLPGHEAWEWFARWLIDEAEMPHAGEALLWAGEHGREPVKQYSAYAVKDSGNGFPPPKSHDWLISELPRELYDALPGHLEGFRATNGYTADNGVPEYKEFRTAREAWEQLLLAAEAVKFRYRNGEVSYGG